MCYNNQAQLWHQDYIHIIYYVLLFYYLYYYHYHYHYHYQYYFHYYHYHIILYMQITTVIQGAPEGVVNCQISWFSWFQVLTKER